MKAIFAIPLVCLALAPLPAAAGEFAPMALNSVAAVPAKITGAKVMDAHGVQVGSVARVETDPMGKPLKADITLTGGRMIFLEASALGYDENANVLVTAMDQQQLVQMTQASHG